MYKRQGLSTDSSFRFERGIDPNGTIYALKEAALLVQELAGGTISSEIKDNYPCLLYTSSGRYRNLFSRYTNGRATKAQRGCGRFQ